jgi:membrane protein implicated in regulation of membrane protease activity
MSHLLTTLGTWNWLIAALLLMALELIAPGVFLFWLGLAALIVGVVSFGVAWSWQVQLVTFAVLAIAAVPLWRRFAQRASAPSDHAFLNRRADALVGRVFTLDKPIVDGHGTVRVGDTVWRIDGPDTPAGSRVRVTATDGAKLTVIAA